MSTLPRPTGKELVSARDRVGFVAERTRGSHCFLRHRDGRATVVPVGSRTLGLGLLRKILAERSMERKDLLDFL